MQSPLRFGLFAALACEADGPALEPVTDAPVEVNVPEEPANPGPERPAAAANAARELVDADLDLDLDARLGAVTLVVGASDVPGLTLEKGDLTILSVEDHEGPLAFRVSGRQLDVGVPASKGTYQISIHYRFERHRAAVGWMPAHGVTFLWPTFCGNLFPCHSDPADGLTFSLDVSGVPDGETAIYPTRIPTDAPSYMPALAVAKFRELDLGRTAAGTEVRAWYLPGQAEAARRGTANLRGVFEFLETTYGPYRFGTKVGSVSANWEPNPTGGMEHHPYWHVGKDDFNDEEVHAHEAAHGWFGNGVRIACWEDFVLSEGTTSYISARALESQGVDVWPQFDEILAFDCNPRHGSNTEALLDTCGEIDLLHHPLWSTVPYMKGARFYKEVAAVIGVETVDAVISDFYIQNVGKAARMSAMVDALRAAAGADADAVTALEAAWLRTEACPGDWGGQ